MTRDDLERDGEECVACEDGDAFAENLVVGGASAAEVIVVHARKIIVDERIGMDAFDGGCGWEGVCGGASAGFGCGDAGGWAQALSASKQAVAHGLVDGGWFRGCFGNPLVQELFHGDGLRG